MPLYLLDRLTTGLFEKVIKSSLELMLSTKPGRTGAIESGDRLGIWLGRLTP